jgi:hypothetical protein
MKRIPLDVRIHDIAVVADPNRRLHDEPELEVYDGTTFPVPASNSVVDGWIQTTGDSTTVWWTGWWPTLHIRFAATVCADTQVVLQLAVDLLCSMTVENLVLNEPVSNTVNSLGLRTATEDAYESYQRFPFQVLDVLKWTVEGLLIAVDILSAPGALLPPPVYQALIGLLISASVLLIIWLYSIYAMVQSNPEQIGTAISNLFEMMVFTLGTTVLTAWSARVEWLANFWYMRGLLNVGESVSWGSVFHFVNVAIKAGFFILYLIMLVSFWKMWLAGYAANPAYSAGT